MSDPASFEDRPMEDASGIENDERLPRVGANSTPYTINKIMGNGAAWPRTAKSLIFMIRRLIDHVSHMLNEHSLSLRNSHL